MKQHVKDFGKTVTRYVDSETGELVDTDIQKHQYLAGDSEEFFLVYSSLLNVISAWNLSVADINMYAYLCSQYATGNAFSITAFVKDEVSRMSGKKPSSFNNSTRVLLSKGLIVQVSGRSYKLNPQYIYKGSSKNRNKAVLEILQVEKNK